MSSARISVRGAPSSVASFSSERPQYPNREEIIMTPLKAKVGQILRVERAATGIKDNKKVHYFAEGPYKGIIVNKATNVRPYKTAPETLRRFVAYIHDQGFMNKELREIRFWFKGYIDSGVMEDYSTQFFRELINPTDFPKDHLQFVKRVLTLVQKNTYSVLKFLELEMRPYSPSDDPIDVRGQPFVADPRQFRKTTSTVEDRHPVRQTTSSDDLHGGQGRKRTRRLTVSGTEKSRIADNAVPTVFVFNPESEGAGKKTKKKVSGGSELVRSQAMENLIFDDNRTEDSVFNANEEKSPHQIEAVTEPVMRRSNGPQTTGAHGNHSPTAKERKSITATSPNSVEATRPPSRPPRPSRDSTDGTVTSPPIPAQRRPSRRPKSSTEIRNPERNPSRNSFTGPDAVDSPAVEPKLNGRRSSSKRKNRPDHIAQVSPASSFRKSRVVSVLEDAFPTMLSVEELTRLSRMKEEEVEEELSRLSAGGVATQAKSGMWVRSQVLKRLEPSSPTGQNNHHKNEFRMGASAPRVPDEDQPTIAVITSLYCEKLAVDAMMDVKSTYVKHKTQGGSGLVYTVGLIDRHRVVTTKLSKLGHGTETKLSAESTIPQLLETFGHLEHILLVGVGGGVADYEDDTNHVRLGNVVVSKETDRSNHFLYFHVNTDDTDQSSSITLETRPWASGASELRALVGKLQRAPKKLLKQLDGFMQEATKDLERPGDISFARPPTSSDQLYRRTMNDEHPVPHPEVVPGSAREQRPELPLIHFGAVATGRILTEDDDIRTQFCRQQKVKAVDSGFQAVLDSLENQQGLNFTIIRGISDYADGTRNKEWQPYAALVAAAVMKCIIMRLSLPEDEDGVV